jgi:hypothetical protein
MSSRITRRGGGGRPDHDERRQRRVPDLRAHTTGGGETGRNERWSNGDHRSELGSAEVTGGGRSGGGDGGGQGSGGGARGSLVMPRAGGCGFFILAMATKKSGRPDASGARTEAFPFFFEHTNTHERAAVLARLKIVTNELS